MKRLVWSIVLVVALAGSVVSLSAAQTGNGIDPEALIGQILMVEQDQSDAIRDLVFDAEYVEGEEKDGEFVEKVRFTKKVYVRYLADTALFHEEYLEYYKDGELQSDKERDKQAEERIEKKRKRNARDISFSMLQPFTPQWRDLYEISYEGVVDERGEGAVCHHFKVTALEKVDSLINGDFYFDAESFHLVRVDFSPAKLVKKAMFKLNDLSMSIAYAETADGYWLPRQFDVEGKGKAMFFIGVKFAGTEYYSNPVINGGIDDELFEVKDGL